MVNARENMGARSSDIVLCSDRDWPLSESKQYLGCFVYSNSIWDMLRITYIIEL